MAQGANQKEMPTNYHDPQNFTKLSFDSRMVTHRMKEKHRQEVREFGRVRAQTVYLVLTVSVQSRARAPLNFSSFFACDKTN